MKYDGAGVKEKIRISFYSTDFWVRFLILSQMYDGASVKEKNILYDRLWGGGGGGGG